MSNPGIHFQGGESLDEIFTQLPEQYRKPVMQRIFAKAAGKFIRDAKKPFNGSLKKAVGYVNGKSTERPAIWAGLVKKNGNSWPFQRAYWRNFGTLANRDPDFDFKNPVKKRVKRNKKSTSQRQVKGGIMHANYVGKAWESNQSEAERVITQEAAAIATRYLQSKAKK